MVVRLVLLALVVAAFGMMAMRSMAALQAVAEGLVAGVLVGVLGLRLTRFESDENGRYYTPNAYIGVAVTMLLVARVVYRMASVYSMPQLAPAAGAYPFAAMTQSPLTLGVAMLTLGYYITYTAGVLMTGTSRYESKSPPV
jgi:hypothetical protein